MLGRHKRQRTNSRSECQKTNCDFLYFSYFPICCSRCCCCFLSPVCLLLPLLCVCVLFISDKSTSRASGKCKLRTFSLSLSFSTYCSPSHSLSSIDYRLGHLLMKSVPSKKSRKNHSKCVCKFAEAIY